MQYRVIFDENSPYWSKSNDDNDEFVRTIQDWAKAELTKNKVLYSRQDKEERDTNEPVLYLEQVLAMFDFPRYYGYGIGWTSLDDVRIYATDLEQFMIITLDGLVKGKYRRFPDTTTRRREVF